VGIALHLDWCSHEAAKYAVEHWHYSKSLPSSKTVKIGVWEYGVFVGCVVFGIGATSALVAPYGLKPTQGAELCRIALANHKSHVSRILAIAVKMLRKQSPGLRLIVSFADSEQLHVGSIYQASNWIFTGVTNAADEYIVRGKRMHGRSMRSVYGTHVGKDFIIKMKGGVKYRYLLALDDEIRAQIEPLRKPYPKRAGSVNSRTPGNHPGGDGAVPISALQ